VTIYAAKHYRGERAQDGTALVCRTSIAGVERPLKHLVRHSPTGFNWGYGGSGPADLARSLLADFLGFDPPAAVYQAFKFDVLAHLPGDAPWTLDPEQLRLSLDAIRTTLHIDCLNCLDSRRVFMDGSPTMNCPTCGHRVCRNASDSCSNLATGDDGLCDHCRFQIAGGDLRQAEHVERRLRDKDRAGE